MLRDGGPLAFAVWRTPDRNPWAGIPGMTLVQRGHMPAPEPGAPGIFALGEPDRIRELVTGAGFGEPELEEIAFEFRYADSDDLWDALVRLAGPLARAVKALPDDERRGDPRGDHGEHRRVPQRRRLLHRSRGDLGRARSLISARARRDDYMTCGRLRRPDQPVSELKLLIN